jgi:hypothetical protein
LCIGFNVILFEGCIYRAHVVQGVKYLVDNFPSLISILDMEPSQGAAVDCGAGLHRIAIVELMCIILLPCLSLVEEHIISSGVLAKLLKLFSDFPRNSILHCVVVRCLQVYQTFLLDLRSVSLSCMAQFMLLKWDVCFHAVVYLCL